MEHLPLGRESGVRRVANASPEEEDAIFDHYADRLRAHDVVVRQEREKTEEEIRLVEAALGRLPPFITRYGGEPLEGLTSANIHVLDPEKLSADERRALTESNERGWYDFDLQGVVVLPSQARLLFFKTVVHELLHLHSFVSLNVERQKPEGASPGTMDAGGIPVTARRIGFGIYDPKGGKAFFAKLDEAIIEELAIRFDKEYVGTVPELKEELGDRQRLRALLDDDEVAASLRGRVSDWRHQATVYRAAYAAERRLLHGLLKQLFETHRKRFGAEEEVFRLFTRAVFTGRIRDIARIIETTYGKGSFRALGGETEDIRR